MFTTPNRITKADFDSWVEQRGPSSGRRGIALHADARDVGPGPGAAERRLAARAVGKGHYTYFAYAFHRQLPYGVPGAYRLLANLLSLRALAQLPRDIVRARESTARVHACPPPSGWIARGDRLHRASLSVREVTTPEPSVRPDPKPLREVPEAPE